MVVFKSSIPDIEIPQTGIIQYAFSNPNKISEDKAVFIDGTTDKKLTFAELKSNSKKFAAGLQDKLNFKRGDVLSIFSPNQVDYTTVIFGTLIAGGTISPANPMYKVEEFASQLKDSGSSIIITHPIVLTTAIGAAKAANIPESKIFIFGDEKISEILPYTSLFSTREAIPIEYSPEEAKTTTAFLCYSSGTTGKQKGVETTHCNLVSNVAQILAIEDGAHPGSVYMGVLPFYHIYGLNILIHFVLVLGASCIVLPRYEFTTFCRLVQDYKISMAHVVPPIILELVKNPKVEDYDLSSLKLLTSGAAPLSEDLSKTFKNSRKINVRQGYGLTETSPVVFLGHDKNIVFGSCGILLPNIECKLISDNGQESNNLGELCVRGPNVMKGYLNNKEATDSVFDKDGYFHTGDIATVDNDGNFYIVDRVKELIKYKGFQVAPAELEAVLLSHPSILDAAVIGINSEEGTTEHPVAYIVTQQGVQQNDEFCEEIQKYVGDQVAPYKKLRGGIYYIDKIPKSLSGKILRRVVKEYHLANNAK